MTMAFKLMEVVQKKMVPARGYKLLADVIEGIKFVNGVKQNGDRKQEAAKFSIYRDLVKFDWDETSLSRQK